MNSHSSEGRFWEQLNVNTSDIQSLASRTAPRKSMVYALWSHGGDRCDQFYPSGFGHYVSSCIRRACSVTWAREPTIASHGCAYPVTLEIGKNAQVKKQGLGASLVAQWLRVCLPMQGTRVRALVWEDPTCRGATGPVSHNY